MINNGNTEYDSMKNLINKMRHYNIQLENQQKKDNLLFGEKQQPIREAEREITDVELQTEKDELGNAVSKPLDIISFKIYSDNIEMVFKLIKEDIQVTFSLDDPEGLYITSREIIQLNDNMLQAFQELKSYYQQWSEKWGDQL